MKDPAIGRTTGEAFPQHLFRRSVLTGRLSHFRGPFAGAAFHFLRSHVFDVLREAPLVTKRIGDFPVAVSPELIHGGWRVRGSLATLISSKIIASNEFHPRCIQSRRLQESNT
jgi:hypothetical protein